MTRWCITPAVLAALLLAGSSGFAQAPATPGGAPASPDTATAMITLPEILTGVRSWTVQPDSVTFGGPVVLVPVDGPAEAMPTQGDELVAEQ